MDDTPNGREDELDLGGERACWLDEVCVSCGAVDGHRPGCEFTKLDHDVVTREVDTRTSTHASGPAGDGCRPVWSISPIEPAGRTL